MFEKLNLEVPKNLALTGRIKDWLKNPASRLPVSCTTFSVEDSMEGKDGIEDSWNFTSKALRNAAGVAIDLSKLRSSGTKNGKGLVSSGPVSFVKIYSVLNEVLRRGGIFKNGACTSFLDYNHPDIKVYLNITPQELPWVKRAIYVDDNLLSSPYIDLIIKKVKEGYIWLAKKQWDQDGNRLYSNVCVTEDSWINTREGIKQVKDLVGVNFEADINGKYYPSLSPNIYHEELDILEPSAYIGFYPTGINPVYLLSTKEGYSIEVTENHEFFLAYSGLKIAAKNLKKGDKLQMIGLPYNIQDISSFESLEYIGDKNTYDCTIQDVHRFVANNFLVSNCQEILLQSRGTCLLAHVNLGSSTIEDIPLAFEQGMKFLCELHSQTGTNQSGIYLSPEEDRQVGLGVIGLANLLAIENVTYSEFVYALEYYLDFFGELDHYVVNQKACFIVESLLEGYRLAANIANEYEMDRAFTVAPTATCSYKHRDRELYTTSPEISPPINLVVDRDSGTFGVTTYEYNPKSETAREVGWDVQYRLMKAWQTMMDQTGLSHAISFNIWETCEVDKEFLQDWLNSPLKTTYYRLPILQEALNKAEVITDTEEDPSVACNLDGECTSCAE